MKITNTPTKLFALILTIVITSLAAVWLGWKTNPVQAIEDFEIGTVSWGVAPGQTARLNLLNCGDAPEGLVINWSFLDADGRVLKRSPGPLLIEPGRTISVDLGADQLNAPRDRFGRIQMRAVVKGLGGPDTFSRQAAASVEVIDNATGRTAVFVSGAAVKGCSNNL